MRRLGGARWNGVEQNAERKGIGIPLGVGRRPGGKMKRRVGLARMHQRRAERRSDATTGRRPME